MDVSVIANSEVKSGAWLKRSLSGIVVAADGGANICKRYGITPRYIIGDFDSIQKSTLTFFRERSKIVHDSNQESTDLQKALALAKKLKAKKIFIFGALGGNLDHTMANILSLNEKCVILDETQTARIVNKQAKIIGKVGDLVSVIAITNVTGLAYSGLKWKPSHSSVPAGWIGVRNRLVKRQARVTLKSGTIAVIKVKQ